MFSEMFGVLEHLAPRVTTVLVSRHDTAPTQIPHVLARHDAPATSSIVVTDSSAGTARVLGSPSMSNRRSHRLQAQSRYCSPNGGTSERIVSDLSVHISHAFSTALRDPPSTVRPLFDKSALLEFALDVSLQHERPFARRTTVKFEQRFFRLGTQLFCHTTPSSFSTLRRLPRLQGSLYEATASCTVCAVR
jgi:hypothetical protein